MYIARMVMKLLMYLIPAFAMALLCCVMLKRKEHFYLGKSLRQYKRKLPLLVLCTVVYLGVCLVYHILDQTYTCSVKLGYNYIEASKGLTPNKTKLDVQEILDSQVLETAIETGGFHTLTSDGLKDTLSIENVKAKESIALDNYYLSTEYRIIYKADADSSKYEGTDILQAVSQSYYDFFVNKYSRKINILTEEFKEAEGLDYLDAYTYYNTKISNICDYMAMCEKENSGFTSQITKESFRSLKEKAQNYRSVALERYRAYVLEKGLSKDREQYIAKLDYNNKITNINYMKNLAAYKVRLAAIDKYERDVVRSVLVPTRDSDGQYYQSRTKLGTDYFAKEASDYLEYATDKQLQIEKNNYNIAQLGQSTATQEDYRKADSMLADLSKEIEMLSAQAVQTVEDYDRQVSKNYINFSFPEPQEQRRQAVKKAAVYTAAFFGIISCTALVHENKR